MCCKCCSITQRKIWVFGLGALCVALGTTLIITWPDMAEKILMNGLLIKEGTEAYKNWKEAPIPIYLAFYMFNWTNPEAIRNPNVKPNFVEMGPYVFLEKHFKENITFYPNETVSYFERRTWFFDEERSNGKLNDMVTAAHAITATVADEMRHKNKYMKKIINFILNHEGGKLYTTKPVGEWIFDGYQDDLIDFLKLFNTSKIDIPYQRFGWLADRNDSAEYDGLFTIHTGVGDMTNLGHISNWNGRNYSGFYEMPCGVVNGTTGDVFPPKINPNEEITLFVTDVCRFMNLAPNGTTEHQGIEGVQWMGTIETLDSGENYPSQKCFCNPAHEECPKTGVVDCKKCRYNAPIYASFPHFYLADKSYRDAVTGLQPDAEKHRLTLAIEPYTGLPLKVRARVQINMMIEPDNIFDIYRGVPKVLMPMFWFEQRAELDNKLARKAKLGINLGSYGLYLGISLASLGGILIFVGIVLTVTKRWKRLPNDDEDMLTNQPEM